MVLRRRKNAGPKPRSGFEDANQDLQVGFVGGTHAVFVGAARQEELLNLCTNHDEVLAAADHNVEMSSGSRAVGLRHIMAVRYDDKSNNGSSSSGTSHMLSDLDIDSETL